MQHHHSPHAGATHMDSRPQPHLMEADDAVGAWPLATTSESRASSPAFGQPSQHVLPEATTADPASAPDDERMRFLYWRSLQQQQQQQGHKLQASPRSSQHSTPSRLPPPQAFFPTQVVQQQEQDGTVPSTGQQGISCPASPFSPSTAELLHQLHDLQEQLTSKCSSSYMGIPSTGQPHAAQSPAHVAAAQDASSFMQRHAVPVSVNSSGSSAHAGSAQIQALLQSMQQHMSGQGSPAAAASPRMHAGTGEAPAQSCTGHGSQGYVDHSSVCAGTASAGSKAHGVPISMPAPAAAPNPWSAQVAGGSPAGAHYPPAPAAVNTSALHVAHNSSMLAPGSPRATQTAAWVLGDAAAADLRRMPAANPPSAATGLGHGSTQPQASGAVAQGTQGRWDAHHGFITATAADTSAVQGTVAHGPAQPHAVTSSKPAMCPSAPAAPAVSAQRGTASAQQQSLMQAIMAWQEGAQTASPDYTPPAALPPVGASAWGAVAGPAGVTSASSTMPAPHMLQPHLPFRQPGPAHPSCSTTEGTVQAQLPASAQQGVPQCFPSQGGFGPAGLGPASAGSFGFGYPQQQSCSQQQQQHAVQQYAAPAPGPGWGSAYHGPAGPLATAGLPAPPQFPPAAEATLAAEQAAQQQQQLEQLLRLQQLQMLQMQMQLQAAAGAAPPGQFRLAPGLQPAPLLPMWGLQPSALFPGTMGGMNSAMMQQVQQQLLSQQLVAMGFPAAAAAAPADVAQQGGHLAASTVVAPGDGPAQDPAAVTSNMHAAARACSSPFQSVQQQAPHAAPGEPAHRVSTGAAGAPAVPSIATAGRSISAGSWLGRWMPLRKSLSCRRSSSSNQHAAPHHHSASSHAELSQVESIPLPGAAAGAAADAFIVPFKTWSGGLAAMPSTIVQCALYPVTAPLAAAYGASSLAIHLVLSVGRTVTAASAWSVHSTALVCVTVSQYQLLALLCCLAAFAAAAEAASTAAAAALNTGRIVVYLAGREGRLFGCAVAVVAFTDVKQLCRLLATQPLLVLHGTEVPSPSIVSRTSSRSAQLPAVQDLPPSDFTAGAQPTEGEGGTATPGGRSLSRGLSSLLGGLFAMTPAASRQQSRGRHGSSMQLMPSTSFSGSRRSSGHWAVDQTQQGQGFEAVIDAAGGLQAATSAQTASRRLTSQDLPVPPPTVYTGSGVLDSQAVFAEVPRPGTQGVAGVARSTLIVYDSLAVVSGLWAGMLLRLWLLLTLQGPAAGCRIWLHAAKTGCYMSAAAAGASAQTVLQVSWYLARLSLVVLGAAKASAANAAQQSDAAAAAAPGGLSPGTSSAWLPAMPSLVLSVLPVFQWAWVQVLAVWSSCGSFLRVATGPRGKALGDVLGSGYAYVSSALTALAAAASSLLLSMRASPTVKGGAGLFSKAGLQEVGIRGLWLAGQLMAWAVTCAFALLERAAGYGAEWALRDVPPVGRAAVYGSAGMIKGLVVEAGRQSSLLAAQLFEAWKAHNA